MRISSIRRRLPRRAPFYNVTYAGSPILQLKHPAFKAKTGVKASITWRNRQAARAAGLRNHREWAELPYAERLAIVTEYEIEWRIEALQSWERDQQLKRK